MSQSQYSISLSWNNKKSELIARSFPDTSPLQFDGAGLGGGADGLRFDGVGGEQGAAFGPGAQVVDLEFHAGGDGNDAAGGSHQVGGGKGLAGEEGGFEGGFDQALDLTTDEAPAGG